MSDAEEQTQQDPAGSDTIEPTEPAPDSAEPVVAKLVQQVESLRHESARYRTERNTAREQLTSARRQLLGANEKVAYLIEPSAIGDVLNSIDVDALFTEDGSLDAQALEQALRDSVGSKPYYANRRLSNGRDAMRRALLNNAPIVRAAKPDPLEQALVRR